MGRATSYTHSGSHREWLRRVFADREEVRQYMSDKTTSKMRHSDTHLVSKVPRNTGLRFRKHRGQVISMYGMSFTVRLFVICLVMLSLSCRGCAVRTPAPVSTQISLSPSVTPAPTTAVVPPLPSRTPLPTSTTTSMPTETSSPTPTATTTPTATPTVTPTLTATATPRPTNTPRPSVAQATRTIKRQCGESRCISTKSMCDDCRVW